MQRLKELFTGEDRAVSPVIGVILMVAITVILAAVIASFVLGLGDETDDVSPNIVFDTEWTQDEDVNSTTITVNTADGDADESTIYIRGSAVAGEIPWEEVGDGIGAGDSATLYLNVDAIDDDDAFEADEEDDNPDWSDVEGEEIVIVFETDDTSDTLDTFTVP